MKFLVKITMPVEAVDEEDARTSTIDLLARAIVRGASQLKCREFIRDQAEIEVVADDKLRGPTGFEIEDLCDLDD